jgi:hypothetical protein
MGTVSQFHIHAKLQLHGNSNHESNLLIRLQDHLFVQQFPISEMSSNLLFALQLISPSWLGAMSVSHLSNQTIFHTSE